MMGLAYTAASYVAYFYVGGLLMRLVVVQPVKDGSAVRGCFASTIALSLSLFTAVLVDMASPALFTSAARAADDGAAVRPSWLARLTGMLHALLQINAPAFTWILLALLLTVIVACPVVLVWSCVHHVLSRGQRTGTGGGQRRRSSSARGRHGSRRSSGTFGSSRRGSGRQRTESPFSSRVDWSDGKQAQQRRRRRWRRACLLLVLALLLLAAAGAWATRTHRLDPRGLRHTAVSAARRVYASVRSRAAALRVPQEIGQIAVEDLDDGAGEVADGAAEVAPAAVPARDAQGGGGTDTEKDKAPAAGEDAQGDAPPPTAAAPGPPSSQPLLTRETRRKPRRLVLPVVDMTQTMSVLSLDLHALVCALTSRVAIVGVAMIGLLAGYAAITSPFLFLAPYAYWRGREEELRKAQTNFTKKLCYVLAGYGAAQRQIASLQYAILHEEYAAAAASAAAAGGGGGSAAPSFMSVQTPDSLGGYAPPTSTSPMSGYASAAKASSTGAYYPYHAYPGGNGIGGVDYGDNANVGFAAAEGRPTSTPGGRATPLQPSQLQAGRATRGASGGAVGWLQHKLSCAASAVVGSAAAARQSPEAPGSGQRGGSPAQSRQFAVARIRKLRGEAAASRFLGLSLYLQLHEVEEMLREAQRGSTWVGRWYAALGAAMALYSAVKIGLTVASLWLWKASTQDPVTRAVSLLEDAFILRRHDGVASFSVTAVEVSTHLILALALAVNGWMVVNSIRGALLALFHVTMSFSGSAISRPETVAVALSMLIGVYFIGQLVLLRSSLPGSSSRQLEGATRSAAAADLTSSNVLLTVLGSLPYYYYQRLNDWCFVVGCCGAVLVRRFVMRDAVSAVVYTASGGEER